MKILIATDIPITFVCGSTYFIKRLGALLQTRGHTAVFLCPGRVTNHENYITEDGITVYGIRSFPAVIQKNLRLSPPIAIRKAITRAIHEFQPDVIHAQTHFSLPYIALKIAREMHIPTIATNHFIPENIFYQLYFVRRFESLLRSIGWKHLHMVFRHVDEVTTPTETAAEFLRSSGFPKSVRSISNGVDLKKFHPNHEGSAVRKKYGLPETPIVLYVGRLDPEKNVESLLFAMTFFPARLRAHLVIVGQGVKEAYLKKLAVKLDLGKKITFTGFIPDEDLPKIYCLADCFVMPGTAELQSIATMEAMASGLPIIAANALALPELVHHAENGYLYDPDNVKDAAVRIEQILSDESLRRRMGEKSLEIIQHHDIQKTLERFESLYRDVIRKNDERLLAVD